MNPRTRAVVVLAAALVVFGFGVHYGAVADDQWPYPTADEVDAAYGSHVGEEVLLFGTVESVDDAGNTATMRVDSSMGSFVITVRSFDATVRPGGVVQVLGTLREGHVLDADVVRVVNPTGSSTLYKYGVSVVGALLVVALFFMHWRVNVADLAVEGR